VTRISGGGDGAFGGNSVFSEETLTQTGTGATVSQPTEADRARGDTGTDAADAEGAAAAQELAEVEQALLARGGESMTMEQLLRHVVTRVTDEGLVIELFDLPDAPLFIGDTAQMTEDGVALVTMLAEVLAISTNDIAVNGYVRSHPITLIDNPVWPLSANRAQTLRVVLEAEDMPTARIQRVTGFADRKPATTDPTTVRNNRMEIVLLRRDR
jgi:chemotaxis protein MotB